MKTKQEIINEIQEKERSSFSDQEFFYLKPHVEITCQEIIKALQKEFPHIFKELRGWGEYEVSRGGKLGPYADVALLYYINNTLSVLSVQYSFRAILSGKQDILDRWKPSLRALIIDNVT